MMNERQELDHVIEVLGRALGFPVVGVDPADAAGKVQVFAHTAGSLAELAAEHLNALTSTGFRLDITELGNDAFMPEPEREVSRLLRVAADRVGEYGARDEFLKDVNGNAVGRFFFAAATDEP